MDKIQESEQLVDLVLNNNLGQVEQVESMVDSVLDKVEVVSEDNAYQTFFKGMLQKWGVKSPAGLSDEKKKEFFAQVKSGWAKEKFKK